MHFLGLVFDDMNEAGVREEFVAPLLRQLGYRSGSRNNIIREQTLRYPRDFLGRKKDSDPLLRGKADYICEVDRRIRWVIEAKAPGDDIAPDDIDQAYTYAKHPEVRSVYFCLTNGNRFLVYRTDHSPAAPPVLAVDYCDLPGAYPAMEGLLSPVSIERDHPWTQVDAGVPIAPALRSNAQILGGRVTIHESDPDLPQLRGLNHSITGGSIERSEDGSLIVYIDILGPFQSLQEFARRFGLDRIELLSSDRELSSDALRPSVFTRSSRLIVPEGERIFDLQSWSFIVSPVRLEATATTQARVSLDGRRLRGTWSQRIDFAAINFTLLVDGDFDVQVS